MGNLIISSCLFFRYNIFTGAEAKYNQIFPGRSKKTEFESKIVIIGHAILIKILPRKD